MLFLTLILLATVLYGVSADCCGRGKCYDCTDGTPCCGIDACNIFCCGCECRQRRTLLMANSTELRLDYNQTKLNRVLYKFATIDSDGDNKLSLKEAAKYVNGARPKMTKSTVLKAFNDLDRNGDGFIDHEEFDGKHSPVVSQRIKTPRFMVANDSEVEPLGSSSICDVEQSCDAVYDQLRPNPGDLLAFPIKKILFVTIYHYVMYVGKENGNHQVIGIDGNYIRKRGPTACDCSQVEIDNLDEPAWSHYHVRPRSDAVQRALNDVDQWKEYYYSTKNCEYYVTHWRFGYGFSKQSWYYPTYDGVC